MAPIGFRSISLWRLTFFSDRRYALNVNLSYVSNLLYMFFLNIIPITISAQTIKNTIIVGEGANLEFGGQIETIDDENDGGGSGQNTASISNSTMQTSGDGDGSDLTNSSILFFDTITTSGDGSEGISINATGSKGFNLINFPAGSISTSGPGADGISLSNGDGESAVRNVIQMVKKHCFKK